MSQKQKSGFDVSKTFFVFAILMLFGQILFSQAKIPSDYIIRTFIDENGKSIDEIIVPGRPPANHREPAVELPEPSRNVNILSNVPAFDWSYGCSATSAAMIAGFYDNDSYPNMYTGATNAGVIPMDNSVWGSGECPLSATHQGIDGLSVRGHVDDYWHEEGSTTDPYYGNWTEHNYADCTADYMGTNQYYNCQNIDGSTSFYQFTDGSPLYDYTGCEPDRKDGCHGFREFFESRGYSIQTNGNYTQYIYGYEGNTIGFTYDQFKAEIDAGRPVMIHVTGHTMVGFGYDDNSNLVYIHDTWDYSNHTMTWGGTYSGLQHYAVSVYVLEPVTSITFTDINAGLTGFRGSALCWGDYDNDGDLDLAIAGYENVGYGISKIYRNDNGIFIDINAGITGSSHCALSWGDYDNDGDLDLAIAGYTGIINSGNKISKIYRNDNGNFVDINAGIIGVDYGALSWGDYDNDGDLDLAIAGNPVSASIGKIYRNDNGIFIDINAGLTGVWACMLSWGDYDNDGDLDLAIAGYTNSGAISKIYSNDNGNFTDINAGLTGVWYCALSWGDYDNDGDLDLAIAGLTTSYNRISKIYRNDDGNFADINAGLTGVRDCALSWGDYDNDGDLDLAISGSQTSKIYRNDDGNFVDINAGLTGVEDCALSWGDYDNDGDLDLVIAGISGWYKISKIYKNEGCNNNWIDIQSIGVQSNADGVGAWVKCGSSSQWREVSAGEGWVNRMAHFGIGNQTEIDEITVHWPKSGITDTLLQVQANQKIMIYEGDQSIVNIIRPNGGEILPGAPGQNNTYEIMWNVENPPTIIDHITIYYSTDSGNSFPYLIADNEPDDGTFLWTVPNVNTSTTRIRIQFKDVNGSVLFEGISYADFSIDIVPPAGTLTLVSPANGNWTSGTPYFDWSISSLVDVTNIGIIVDGEYLITGLPTSPSNYQTSDDLALSSGWHTWTLRGLDEAGNWVQASQTWSLQIDATPPTQFYLQSPQDDIWTATPPPTFQWTPSMDNGSGLAKYQLYISGHLEVDNISPSVTQWSSNFVAMSDGYWCWYVVAEDNAGNTQCSQDTFGFHIDATAPYGVVGNFTCLHPSNNFWTADSLITFSWSSCMDDGVGLAYYELFIDGATISGQISDTTYTLTSQQVLENGNHSWYVNAADSLGNSASTSSRSLIIDRIAPADFSLIDPADSSFFVMPTPNFEWNPTTDAGSGLSHYELWIDDVLNVNNLSQAQSAPGLALSEGYHIWYVIAEDNMGNRVKSTESWTAIGDWNPPQAFTLIEPIDQATLSVSRPLFKWHASSDIGSGLSKYELCISGQPPIIILPTDTTKLLDFTLPNGPYTWYVKAFDGSNAFTSSNSHNLNINFPSQTIDLNLGWNIMSFYVEPAEVSLLSILQPLVSSSELTKVIDQSGGFIQNIPGIGWMNTIGDMKNTEGYYVKVSNNTMFEAAGSIVNLPYSIPLSLGWNILGYPLQTSQDAIAALQQLIDNGSLMKVINESGGFIQFIPGIGWMNTIGDFEPGEGYYIKLNSNDTLVINESASKSTSQTNIIHEGDYYRRSTSGNPYLPMHVVANFDEDIELETGDELGVFIHNECLGSGVITDPRAPVVVFLTTDDPTTEHIDGGQPGDVLQFKLLHLGGEYELQSQEQVGYEPLETRVLTFTATGLDILENDETGFAVSEVIPNPFSTEARVCVTIAEKGKLKASMVDLRGIMVKSLFEGDVEKGKTEVLIDGNGLNQGMYFVRLEYGNDGINKEVLRKVIIHQQ